MDLAASASDLGAVVLAVDPSKVKPGWTAFIVFIVLVAAVAVLLRSFTKQLKKVTFDEDATEQPRRRGGSPERSEPREHTAPSEHSGSSGSSEHSAPSEHSDGSGDDPAR